MIGGLTQLTGLKTALVYFRMRGACLMKNNKFIFKEKLISEIGFNHKGGNFILDKGLPYDIYVSYIKSFSKYMKMVKFGWTAWSIFSNEEIQAKIDISNKYSVPVCFGGSLFEIAYDKNIYEELLQFITGHSLQSIELGSGFAVDYEILPDALRKAKKAGLTVMIEIGYKNQELDAGLSIQDRIAHIKSAVDAGADYIILEAREVGEGYSVFKKDEKENKKLLDAILHVVPAEKIVFEAPNRHTQVDMIKRIGADVNLGNIPFDEIPRVESFRRKLHADTYIKSYAK